jgi:hypothetical protein
MRKRHIFNFALKIDMYTPVPNFKFEKKLTEILFSTKKNIVKKSSPICCAVAPKDYTNFQAENMY